MQYINGNLITLAQQGHFDFIVHGCNCFHSFGAGIARQIKQAYPKAYEADLITRKGDAGKLGTYSLARYPGVVIVNAYTQYRYGTTGIQADYQAIERVFRTLAERIDDDRRIGIPKIGAGLAGGDWSQIEAIIDDCLQDFNVTCVVYDET